ncbi:MAG: MlaD family protein [Candidatus Electryonea clarkiae]|nr:MlaD family protein [Candidatus Electryonea clarkiae]MDP8286549.1 MlaD family protein [Candidatus Electryonea clarkiae]
MEKKQNLTAEFWVGLTVLAAIIILIGGIIWGKGVTFQTEHQFFQVQFMEVYGLKEGSSVLVQGVARGKVGTISLDANRAVVDINLDHGVILYKDTQVLLFTPQLMGGRMVSIDPGSGPEQLEPGSVITGEVPAGVGEVMAASGEVLNEIRRMMGHLNNTVAHVESVLSVSKLGGRLDISLNDLNETTSMLRARLDSTSNKLKYGAERIADTGDELHMFVTDNRPKIDSLVIQMQGVANDVSIVSTNLKSLSEAVSDTTGSIGKMIYSDTLHDQIVRTLADIDSLAAKLKKEGVKIRLF